jgi:hypothetical protein
MVGLGCGWISSRTGFLSGGWRVGRLFWGRPSRLGVLTAGRFMLGLLTASYPCEGREVRGLMSEVVVAGWGSPLRSSSAFALFDGGASAADPHEGGSVFAKQASHYAAVARDVVVRAVRVTAAALRSTVGRVRSRGLSRGFRSSARRASSRSAGGGPDGPGEPRAAVAASCVAGLLLPRSCWAVAS